MRLVVKNFGPIVEADIEVSPFALFVGESGSGKSITARLLYAIRNIFGDAVRDLYVRGAEKSVDEVVNKLNFAEAFKMYLGMVPRGGYMEYQDNDVSLTIRIDGNVKVERLELSDSYRQRIEAARDVEKGLHLFTAFCMPAGRSGLVDSFPLWNFTNKRLLEIDVKLTTIIPVSMCVKMFYHALELLRNEQGPLASVVEPFEEILGGRVVMTKNGIVYNGIEIRYAPTYVKEFAPIYMITRELLKPGDFVAIEGPSANMHPEVQAVMADFLTKLAEAGVYLVVEAQDEAFLWRISNLAKLGRLKLNAYLFKRGRPVERLKELNGIPTYNEVFNKLYDEYVKASYSSRRRGGQ
ncbi:MAG: hypothetical protein ACK4SY_07650 [Pyrobaculum sp.]